MSEEYGIAFGINYGNPNKYLTQGKQSQISDPTHFQTLYSNEKGLDNLKNIYYWMKDEFSPYSAGGKTIGKVTADELLEKKSLGGCHDYALVYTAVVREIGYPAVMARTSSIVWVEHFKVDEEARPRIGHVFVEVYLNNRWILIDPTNGWYLEEGYDPSNPVIPLRGNIAGQTEEIYGFYVERKGLDIWDMDIHNQAESGRSMDELAHRLNLDSITYPSYNFKKFSR
ncbi:MAG: transglutaminase-like domain-containing protein [Candidatus Humimicrobiaceae bacterium]